jgi:transposase
VLEILSGRVSIHEVGQHFGVREETVDGWLEDARAGILVCMRQGSGKTAREMELEKELKNLKSAFTKMAIQNELIKNAMEQRPFLQRRSQK